MKVKIMRKDGVPQHYHIVRKTLKKDFGTNYYANKELKEGRAVKKNEIWVDRNLRGRMLKRTIAHEKMEAHLMRDRHMPYNQAHAIAQKFEMNIK